MNQKELAKWLFKDGYISSALEALDLRGAMLPGSKNVLMSGAGKPVAFKGLADLANFGSRMMTQASGKFAGLGDFAQTGANGSVERILAALFFIGSGLLRYNGASQSANATSILQFKTLSNGVWSAQTYQAGLSAPFAPTLAAMSPVAPLTGRLKTGTYSARIYKIRRTGNAKSLASPISNIAAVTESNGTGQSMRITFPPIGASGADAWGICVSPRNFGSTGGHYLLMEILESDLTTIDGVPRSYQIEWTDGDLVGRKLAPIDSYPPPVGNFFGTLGDCAFIDGCYGDLTTGEAGATIAQSLPLRPEEYPPDWLLFPSEPPVALLRGGNGHYYRLGQNSLGVISLVGGSPPLAYYEIWATTGISFPGNACIGDGGRLYAKTGKRGLVRTGAGNEPESLWSAAITDDIADWSDEKIVLGWDEDSQNICIMHERTIIPYNVQLGTWGAPCDCSNILTGDIVSAVTNQGSLLISAKHAGTSLKLYKFNAGTGSLMRIRTDWLDFEATAMLRRIEIGLRAGNMSNVTVKVYANDNNSVPILTKTVPLSKTGRVHLDSIKAAIPNLTNLCIEMDQQTSGGDSGFETVTAYGVQRNYK